MQCALVDQLGCAWARKSVAPRHEIAIADVQGGRHQTTHVDRRPCAKQDAVGVDQKHLAIGREIAQNGRWVGANHPVQRYRLASRLNELHRLPRSDAKALPIDRHVRRGLGDGRATRCLHDAGLTCTHRAACGRCHSQAAPGQHQSH